MRNYLLLVAIVAFCLVSIIFNAQNFSSPSTSSASLPLVECNLPNIHNKTLNEKTLDNLESGYDWSATMVAKSFIENKGQFNDRCAATDSTVKFGIDDGGTQTFFKPTGLTYFVVERIRNPNRVKGDMTKAKKVPKGDFVEFVWAGGNHNVSITAKDVAADYFTYCMLKGENEINPTINNVRGYKQLIYNSLYPGIDAEYVFHPDGGIKYSLLVQPGAKVDNIKMVYPSNREMVLNVEGNLVISTMYGNIIEHAPITHYAGSPNELIPSKFKLVDNTVSFELGNYDTSREIVIDPWVQSPTLASSNCIWECERDAAGNVYVIGGDAPMKLLKYSPTGILQWTYNTPWDATPSAPGQTDGDWLGGLATDKNGISYITRGSKASIQKVSTAGGLVWSAAPTNIFTVDEYWTIAFNCDQTKLVVGGTTGAGLDLKGAIFNINTTNGSVTGQRVVGTNRPSILPGFVNDAMEVRSISSSRNGRYYFITLDSIGSINQNFTPCSTEPLFNDSHGYKFGYKSEEYRPSTGNGPNCAIRANDKFVYTHGGNVVHKRDLASGAIVGTAAIPGGISTVSFGFSQPGNNGIDIDTCGNVYVGSADRVIKFDANLNILTSVALPFRVFDVAVTTGGDIIVCGGTGTSSSTTRTGYVQVVNMNACPQFTLVCCDATVCPAGPLCDNGSPINLVASTPGGIWSGTGITNASTGVFSPTVAGAGTHKIIYTLPCGKDSTYITVNACANLTVCRETNGQYTVKNGTGPYTWQSGVSFQNCTGCPLGNCIPFICPGFADTTWTTFATTATATPPGTFPIRVTDANGNRLKLTSAAGIQPCTVCPTITVTFPSQTNISCTTPTGSATASAAGGVAPYTYLWTPGNLSGASQTGLAANTYTVVATDANSCTGTATVTITSSGSVPTVSVTTTPTTCGLANGSATANVTGGTAPFTYAWSPGGGSTQTITNRASGTYTVTVTGTGGCTATASGTIAPSSGFTTAVTTTPSTCTTNNGTATATNTGGTAPFTYTWSPSGGSAATASNLAPTTYTVQVSDVNSCTATASGTVTQSSGTLALSLTNPVNPTCAGSNGSITAGLSGGTAPYTVTIDTGGTPIVVNIPFAISQTINNLPAGTVNVTVVDAQGCQVINSATLVAPNCCTFTVSAALTQPTCGQSNGSIVLTTANGSGNYTYAWANGSGTGTTASGLGAGTFRVTITDNGFANCFKDTSFTLNSNSSLNLSLTNPVNPTCAGNDGSITVGLSGGTAPYTVTIDTGGTPIVINVPFAISQTINNLPDGTVNVSVVDAQNCQVNNSATLAAPVCCTFTVSAALTQPTCGQSNGSIVITPANGSGNYTYVWANGSGTGNTASSIGAGTYAVTITDNGVANCFIDTSFILSSNSSLALSLTNPVDPTCAGNDGSLTVGLSGGTAPYTVTIDTGGTPIVINVPAAISQTINNLPDGTVNVTVVDAQNCQVNNSATLAAPNCCTFTVSAALTQPTCGQSNGSIVITPANGSGNYTYVWANGAGTGNTASNLAAASYAVTITDNGFANCFIDTVLVLNSSSTLSLSLTNPVNPTCAGNDGSLTVGLSGGTAPYTVTIDTGGTPIVINVPAAISQAINNLPAGTVNVSVVDAQNCQVNNSATLTAPTNCCTFTVSAALTQPACGLSDGGIVITPANGSGNYTYTWANGAGTGNTAANLAANSYAVTITDNGFANCFIDTVFALNNPNAPSLSFVRPMNIPCGGDSTGGTNLVVAGGTAPFDILWSTGDTTIILVGYPVGTYTVTVTDANGCVATASHTITEIPAMVLQLNTTPIDCNDPTSGSAGVAVTGGTAPYTYLWNNGATTPTLNNVTVGTYKVTVTDASGCMAIDSVVVTGDSIASFNLGPNLNICVGDTVILGTGLAGTVWSTGDTSGYLVVAEAGIYSGAITNGTCTNSDTVTIFVEQLPNIPQLNVNDTIVCESESVILRVGDEGYLYVWSTGDTSNQIVVDTPGIYIVTAINECGEVSAEALVTDENCACRLYMPNAFSPNADGANDVFKAYSVCTEIEEYHLTIFDRWGGVVFKSNDFTEVWNGMSKGKACIPGVYVYSLSYLSRENGVRQIYRQKGSVTLLR